jgi:hypothetical protein
MAKLTSQPKKNLTKLGNYTEKFGNSVRKSYQNTILEDAPIFPKPLGYSDIDTAMFSFIENEIDVSIDGKLVPTYTLYSNQRFSEYSQMWEHTDENGNLYLNFKTINREKNPSFGNNQGGLWNIPGKRNYTILRRDVIDENGVECYEIYSMKQPYVTDLSYKVSFVTTTLEYVNEFNQKINKLFAARQCYIRPNGHFIPIILEEVLDETSYSISERKFYVQTITLKLMAYLIDQEDFEIKRYPKRINLMSNDDDGKYRKKKTCVEIEEFENPMKNKTINVNITFEPFVSKTTFTFDSEMKVENVVTENVRNSRTMINDILYYTDKGFNIHENDEIRIQIKPIESSKPSKIVFVGYDPNEFYDSKEVKEKVNEEPITHEEINIE